MIESIAMEEKIVDKNVEQKKWMSSRSSVTQEITFIKTTLLIMMGL